MQRVYIMGTSGSGKSTLGRKLAAKLGCEHLEIDSVYHQAGWTPLPIDEFRGRMASLLSADVWVIDGNYSDVRDLVLARADTLILLDYPKPLVMWRLIRRTLKRGLLRQQLWNGNRESVRFWFSRDPEINLLLWAWNTHARRKALFVDLLADPQLADVTRLRFSHPRELQAWLRGIA